MRPMKLASGLSGNAADAVSAPAAETVRDGQLIDDVDRNEALVEAWNGAAM